MKKNLVFFTLLLTLTVSLVKAQSESSFGSFFALPVGDFGATNLAEGGFAKPGWGLVFDTKTGVQWLPENLGIFIHVSYQLNRMDTEKISQIYTEELGHKTIVSDSKFNPILGTLGPVYDFHLGEYLTLGIKTGIGVMFNNAKAFTIDVYNSNNNAILGGLVKFDNATSFTYLFGPQISFEIVPETLKLVFYTEYVGSKQRVDWSFNDGERIGSFQKLQYWNSGFKISIVRPD